MITEYTQQLIEKHGWTFVPEHDTAFGIQPEHWEHEEHDNCYTVESILAVIANEKSNTQ